MYVHVLFTLNFELCRYSASYWTFFVTKNKVLETDLQLANTVKLRKNIVRRATRSFCDIAFRSNVMSRCFKEIW